MIPITAAPATTSAGWRRLKLRASARIRSVSDSRRYAAKRSMRSAASSASRAGPSRPLSRRLWAMSRTSVAAVPARSPTWVERRSSSSRARVLTSLTTCPPASLASSRAAAPAAAIPLD